MILSQQTLIMFRTHLGLHEKLYRAFTGKTRRECETRKPDLFRAWSRLLSEPVSTIVATMMDESDQGLWLRDGTPFLGIIDNQRSFDILVETFEAVEGRRSAL